MKKFYLVGMFFFLLLAAAWSQERTISGTIVDESGEPIPYVNVLVEGTTRGVISDINGNYSLDVNEGETLVFSYIGFGTQEIVVGSESVIDMKMSEGQDLDGVVVTALGISREKKALGYAVQEISGDDIASSNEANVVNALQGRSAGVLINSSSGTPGAGSNILIRGISSLDPSGSNQPLIVVDGIPISNQTIAGNQLPSNGSNAFSSGEQASFSNRLADINPADIETLNVLKGASATALYGLRGANGVIVITTKKGKTGTASINLTTSYGISQIAKSPEYQSNFREGRFGRLRFRSSRAPLRFQSFGPIVRDGLTPVFDPIDDFFQNGNNGNIALNISGGNEKAQYITSFGYTTQEGIIPFSDWKRLNMKLGGNIEVSPKLKVNGSVNFSNSGGNKPHSGDKSILSALSYHPTSFDVQNYLNSDGTQRDYSDGIIDNPRYLAEFSRLEDDVNRVFGNVGFDYTINHWLDFNFKIGNDFYSDNRERLVPPGLDVSSQTNGFLIKENVTFNEMNTLAFLRAKKQLTNDLHATFSLGNNVTSTSTKLTNTRGEGFTIPNFFDLSNTANVFASESQTKKRIIGVMGLINLAYKDYLFLDITGRNDWSSSLPKENRSFFYPSVSASFIPTELTDLGPLDFLKLRASWAQVAKDAPAHRIGTTFIGASNFPFGSTNGFTLASSAGDLNLKPETTTGIELGFDARFLKNRIGIDFTFYRQNSKDQIISVPVSNATGQSRFLTNAGEIQNTGVEILLDVVPVRKKNFEWDAQFNFSTNEGKVISIRDGIDEIQFFRGGFGNIVNKLVPGGKVGDLYGFNFKKNENGDLIIGADGFPIIETDAEDLKLVGNAMPDFTAGMNNRFTYKGFSVSALLEWRSGGDLYDMGFRNSIRNGVLAMTSRRNEQVIFKGVTEEGNVNETPVEITGESLYRNSRRYNRAADVILEDGSWIRLRRVSIGYQLPSKLFQNLFVKGASVTLSGNNLFINTPFRGYDPETNYLGSGSNVYGFTGLQTPGVKTYTITLNASF